MQRVAFITYNQFDGSFKNGWHRRGERSVFLLQNTRGDEWAGDGAEIGDSSAQIRVRHEEIRILWIELLSVLLTIDHIVVYVGQRGSEMAIELTAKLPSDSVTFVLCACNSEDKAAFIRRAGHGSSRKVWCECGGHLTMENMFHRFLKHGVLE